MLEIDIFNFRNKDIFLGSHGMKSFHNFFQGFMVFDLHAIPPFWKIFWATEFIANESEVLISVSLLSLFIYLLILVLIKHSFRCCINISND